MQKVLGQAMAMQCATLKQEKKINAWVVLMWREVWGVQEGPYMDFLLQSSMQQCIYEAVDPRHKNGVQRTLRRSDIMFHYVPCAMTFMTHGNVI